jgi:hypothetical protein
MNERIRLLAEQAEMSANKGDHVDVKLMMEKFAQLILGECTNLCGAIHSASEHVRGAGDPFGLGAAKCKFMIEERFGIKE